jgi:homocysteine S-methyltransferase
MIDDGEVHLFDGAIGTLLYDRGVFVNVCYDELNLTQPALVEGIHREYVAAGAEILETNTFGASPVKLSGFGLEGKTEEINRAAAILARRAAGERARVVGAIGPLGIRIEPWGPTSREEARGYFQRQVAGLIEGGVDGFLLETFSDLNELREAIEAVRSLSDLPLFAQVTIEEGGSTAYGADIETVARSLDEWGVDVIGVNCSVGPAEILDAVERMAAVTERPLSAQPNAGFPRLVGDRKMYLASPAYMARYAARMAAAGARFVGGCCGTTPEHIHEIRRALADWRGVADPLGGSQGGALRSGAIGAGDADGSDGIGREPVSLEERSGLGEKLVRGEFVISLEILPPRGWDPAPLLDLASEAHDAGVDLLTLVDPSEGLRRMGAVPAAILLTGKGEIEVAVKYRCRGRSMLQMISELLGGASGGVRNLLVVSGEPSRAGPYHDPTAIEDIDSIGLTNILHRLNRGVEPGGEAVDPPTRFVVGVELNQGGGDLEREKERYRWKLDAGADFAVSRPVFDPTELAAFLESFEGRGVPVLAGLAPIASLRDLEYIAQELSGIQVPSAILARMEEAEGRGEETSIAEGTKILGGILDELLPRIAGVHISAPRGEIGAAIALAREVRRRVGGLLARG